MEAVFFQSRDVHGGLNLDPRTKLYLLLILNIVIINGRSSGSAIYVKPMLAAVPFLLLLMSGKRKGSLLYAGIYSISLLTDLFWLQHFTGIGGMVIALLSAFGIRWFPCAMMGYYFVSTTQVSEFVAAMERMKVSQKIIIPLSVMFRFFPTVMEESRSISDAMRMRGVGGANFFSSPTAVLEYRLVPLLMSVVKIGDELSAAALTRGLGGLVKRTNICKIGFGLLDRVLALFATAVLAMYIML